jgi:hypothetical protein
MDGEVMKANNRLRDWFTGDFKRPGGRYQTPAWAPLRPATGLSAVGGNPGLVCTLYRA